MAPHVQPKCFWHPQRLINNRQTGLSYQVWSHKGSNFLVLSFWQKRSWLQLWNISVISVIRGSVKKRMIFWCWCWWGGGESHSRMLDSNWRLTREAERQVSQRHIFIMTIHLHLDHPHLDHLSSSRSSSPWPSSSFSSSSLLSSPWSSHLDQHHIDHLQHLYN